MRYLIQVKKTPDPHWQTLTMTDSHSEALLAEGTAICQSAITATRIIPLGRVPDHPPRIPDTWAMPQNTL